VKTPHKTAVALNTWEIHPTAEIGEDDVPPPPCAGVTPITELPVVKGAVQAVAVVNSELTLAQSVVILMYASPVAQGVQLVQLVTGDPVLR
jgi:hypothetical protein